MKLGRRSREAVEVTGRAGAGRPGAAARRRRRPARQGRPALPPGGLVSRRLARWPGRSGWRCWSGRWRPARRRTRRPTVPVVDGEASRSSRGWWRPTATCAPVKATPVSVPHDVQMAAAHHLAGRRRQHGEEGRRGGPLRRPGAARRGWPTPRPTGPAAAAKRQKESLLLAPPSARTGVRTTRRRPARAGDDPQLPAPGHRRSSRATRSSRAEIDEKLQEAQGRARRAGPGRDRRLPGSKLELIEVEAQQGRRGHPARPAGADGPGDRRPRTTGVLSP